MLHFPFEMFEIPLEIRQTMIGKLNSNFEQFLLKIMRTEA